MRLFAFSILMLFSFTLLGVNDTTFVQKIERSNSSEEKEFIFLDWVDYLSQNNTFYCDSIILNRKNYVDEFSEDGRLHLFLLDIMNKQLGGNNTDPDLNNFHLSRRDSILSANFIASLNLKKIAEEDFKKVKKGSTSHDDPTRESMFMVISAQREETDKRERVSYYNRALKHAKRSKLIGLPCLIFNLFSTHYLFIADFKKSIQNQQKGVTYSKQQGLVAYQAMFLDRVGHMHYGLGDIKRAEEFFFKVLHLSEGLKLDFIVGELYSHLGELYSSKNNLNKSIAYYIKALIKFYPINNFYGLATVHNNIGKAYYQKGDLALAEKNYQLSEGLFKQIKRDGVKGDLYYNMAELYNTKEALYLSEKYINKAISSFQKNKLLIKLNNAYFLYAKIKNSEGKNKKAYQYLERYINFQDSIQEEQLKKNIAQLSELFESEQKEKKIKEQDKIIEKGLAERLLVKNRLENTKKENRLILIILIISLVLSVAIFFIIRTRGKQDRLRKKQREMELQQALLRVQMNPHFIFNSMIAIQSYIYDEDISNSSKFLIHISKLMRLILESSTKEFIPLDVELEIIDRYLVLQKMRFESRFNFKVNSDKIDDHSNISIPPMLLQPFIENAVEHGGLGQVNDGLISINCEINNDLCIFTVEDNGVGIESTLQNGEKKLIKNHQSMASKLTKERIELLNSKYNTKGSLLIEDLSHHGGKGTRVTIATPYMLNS